MLDHEKAEWFAGFVDEALQVISESPCLIVEVDRNPQQWIQILPQMSDDLSLSGYLINLPYRVPDEDPLSHFQSKGIPFPENAELVEFEPEGFATVRIGPEFSPSELVNLAGAAFETLMGAGTNPDLAIRLECGY